MPSSLHLLLSCLLLASSCRAGTPKHRQMEGMVNSMVADKMAEIEKKMETKNHELRMEMKQKDGEVGELREMVEKLEAQNAKLSSQLQEVEQKSVADVQPEMMICAFQSGWDTPDTTITFDYINAFYTNSEQAGGADGSLDIDTGKFSVMTSGQYLVTYSGRAQLNPGEFVYFNLLTNDVGKGREESWWRSYSDKNNPGQIREQGSRSVVSTGLCPHVLVILHSYRYSTWRWETPSA